MGFQVYLYTIRRDELRCLSVDLRVASQAERDVAPTPDAAPFPASPAQELVIAATDVRKSQSQSALVQWPPARLIVALNPNRPHAWTSSSRPMWARVSGSAT